MGSIDIRWTALDQLKPVSVGHNPTDHPVRQQQGWRTGWSVEEERLIGERYH
jgi:hypothetical protein